MVRRFTVTNVGASAAGLDGLELEAADSFALLTAELPATLDVGAWVDVDVAFTPEASGTREGAVRVLSNDTDEPVIGVDLVGVGLVPELRITPTAHDFGAVPPGCTAVVDLVLENVGEASLDLTEVTWWATGNLTLLTPLATPATLAPGATLSTAVAFSPVAVGPAEGRLSVASTDPAGVREAVQTGEGGGGEPRQESFDASDDPAVDILFAVDQSCSRDDEATRLASAFGPLITEIGALTTDWQVGVVTLDSGRVNDALFDSGTAALERRFTAAALEGEDRDIQDDEALLKLSTQALSQAGPGQCNEGLPRAGSAVHVIVVTDEPERSAAWSRAWTWDLWLAAMQDAAVDNTSLVVSGVVDLDGCGEGDDGYAQAIAATGGSALSICASDWSSCAATLATTTAARAWTLPLAEEPLPDSIVVTVAGSELTGWTWDAAANAVVLGGAPGGSRVVVDHAVAVPCE